MNIFEKRYQNVNAIYDNYINSSEYQKHPVVINCDRALGEVVEKIKAHIAPEKFFDIEDMLIGIASNSECAGFILGLNYALGLYKEIS